MKTNKAAEEMVEINFFNGKTKEPWATIDVARSKVDFIQAVADRRGVTLGRQLVDILMDGIKRHGQRMSPSTERMVQNSDSAVPIEEHFERLLTPNAKAVLDRLSRDHHLPSESLITALFNHALAQVEEDLMENGGICDGDLEQLLVDDARRVAAGKSLTWPLKKKRPDHVIGSKSYRDMMNVVRAKEGRNLKRAVA